MPKRLIKRFLPDSHTIREHKHLHRLGDRLHAANLWHINRHSVARAVAIGLFCTFLPMPMQMLLAACFAIIYQANMIISVVLVWISNPITMPPMMFACYKIGASLLRQPPMQGDLKLTVASLFQHLNDIIPALLFGTIICGLLAASLGYLMVRLIWRWSIIYKWRTRHSLSAKTPSRNS